MTYSELNPTVDLYKLVYRNTSQSKQANSNTMMEKNNNASILITLIQVPETKRTTKSTNKLNIGKNNEK